MEEEEVYKQYQTKIIEAQQLLKNLNNIAFAKAHKETRKHVEDHFNMLIKALSERKDYILEKVDKIFTQNGILFIIHLYYYLTVIK